MHVQIPIYVINIAKDTARFASISRQLATQRLQFERVEAVVGKDLSARKKSQSYSPFWYGLFMGRRPSDGELGCNLSHRMVWQMMLERRQDWVIIFEDDAELDTDFAKHLALFESASQDFEVVQFFSLRKPDIFKASMADSKFKLMTYSGPNPTATAYGLRLSGAQKLLKFNRIIFTNDKWVWARALLGLKCAAIYPFPVGMHETLSRQSTIGGTATSKRRGHLLWRLAVLPVLRIVRSAMLKFRGF